MEKTERQKFTSYSETLKADVLSIETTLEPLDPKTPEPETTTLTETTLKTTDDILADLIQTLIEKNII